MRSLAFLLAVILGFGCAYAAEVEPHPPVSIPGTGYDIVVGETQLDTSGQPKRDLTTAVFAWIAAEFDLPATDAMPRMVRASASQMVAIRYREQNSGKAFDPAARNAHPDAGHEILALYDDRARSIYLGEGWSGTTPAEISVLVHEVVHHLQNLSGQRYACGGEREKLAYAAQDRFLALFERTLATEFGIDPMTLLVRTTCVM